VLYWKVQVGGIKRLNQQVLLMLFRSKFYLKMQINGSSFQYDKLGARATRGWSFGSAVVDPRTGEILKGNVSLGSLRVRQDYLIAQGLLAPLKMTIFPPTIECCKWPCNA
jgi:hypothetical protein